jgi:hypothetical protein
MKIEILKKNQNGKTVNQIKNSVESLSNWINQMEEYQGWKIRKNQMY